MTRFAATLSAALFLLPVAAHADCSTDLADTENKAHNHGFDLQKNPRVNALWDKANKAAKTHNDRDCKDALQSLNKLPEMAQ